MLKRNRKFQQIKTVLIINHILIPTVDIGHEFEYLEKIYDFEMKNVTV